MSHDLLRDKVVVVTAAAGTGIGSAVARRALEEGATVMVSDWHERRLASTASDLGVKSIPCDVTSEELFGIVRDGLGDLENLAEELRATAGRLASRHA